MIQSLRPITTGEFVYSGQSHIITVNRSIY